MVVSGLSRSASFLLVLFFMITLSIVIFPALSFNPGDVNSWTLKTPMPTERVSFGVAVVEGKIYAIGGKQGHDFLNTNEMYDPATDKWTPKASMPTPRSGFGVAVIQNKIYAIGGLNYTHDYFFTRANEVYDPVTDTWETRAPMPTPRGRMDANSVEGKIHVIGGDSIHGITGINEVYDPATDTWVARTSAPNPVCVYASAVSHNKIHVIGGWNGSVAVAWNQIYDPLTNTWRFGASVPSAVSRAGAGATAGVWAPQKIYVVGGITDPAQTPYPYVLNKCIRNQIYDPERDVWSGGAALPKSSFDLEVAVVDDVLYAIGGTNSAFFYSIHPLIDNNQQYMPVGYGTVPPTMHLVSPENKNYTSSNVTVAFIANKPAVWVGYSLDGQKNVTITGNTTIAVASVGLHNITVYIKDTLGNIGASETITFNLTEPFPTFFVIAIASAAFVFVMGVGLLVYFKKRSSDARNSGLQMNEVNR
jgi:N-acetylneuraminic acid mutarotase